MSYLKKNTQSQFTSQILATEIYKLINNISPPAINKVFKLNSDSHYNLRQFSQFFRYLVFSEFFILAERYGIYYLMIKLYKTL